MRALLSIILVCVAHIATAACDGADLRAGFSDADSRRIADVVDATPFATGNHWIARKGTKTVRLIGTVHLDDPRLTPVFARLRPALKGADRILVELSPEDQAALQTAISQQPELIFLTEGATLPEMMEEDVWQALVLAARDRGIPAVLAAKFQPWYLSMLLAIPPCAVEDLRSQPKGLDGQIMDFAQTNDLPIQSLEPYDTIFKLFTETPIEEQLQMIQSGLLPPDQIEDMFATVLASYFDEAHAETWEISRILAQSAPGMDASKIDEVFAQMYDTLLVARNLAWMPVILEALKDVDEVVVAAGAAHLSGQEGLLSLLAADGFTVTRQEF